MTFGKTFSLLFVFLFLASCGKGGSGSSDSQQMSDDSITLVDGTVPVQAETFDVNVKMLNFNAQQEEKIHEAVELIKRVVASEEFKNKILNYTYKGKKKFFDTNKSNAQVYKAILEGSEKMLPYGPNNAMDLELELYTDMKAPVIGYTMPNIVKIFMNTKYFNNFQPYQVVDNMIHEWLHKLGFGHSQQPTPDRPHSVPYAVGYIAKALARKMN